MNAESIIFDLDGTLWDSAEGVASSWTETIRNEGIDRIITEADIKGIMGMTMDAIADKFFPDMEETARYALLDICGNEENEYLMTHGGKLFDGVRETLTELSESHRLFIVSNCQKGYIEAFCHSCNTGSFFTSHLCWGDTLAPKSETIRILMERFSITSAVYVGDTAGDCTASNGAEIPFIHAAYGFGDILPPLKADAVINSFGELIHLLR